MDGYSISQVAERTGFSTSALRYYERHGLVEPDRTPAGYRRYDEHHLELLAFVGRAKGFGLTLDEITQLLALLDEDRCAPVQDRLHALVDDRIAGAQRRIAELVAFTAELQRVAAGLGTHTPDGPCDDACGCTRDAPVVLAAAGPRPGAAPRAEPGDGPGIACTLSSEAVVDRVDDWQAMLGGATARSVIDGGVRVRFAAGTEPDALVRLAAAEQSCCRFFTFGVILDADGVALDVTGPPDARSVIDSLFGTAA
jgi:DNA-binding transcriptional MerR regulator